MPPLRSLWLISLPPSRPLRLGGESFPFFHSAFGLFTSAFLLLLSGCATDRIPESRATFANSTINGQPAYVWLDTGAPESALTLSGVERFDLRRDPLPAGTDNPHDAERISTPIHVTLGHNDLVAQFPIHTKPWYFRALFDLEKTSLIIGWPAIRDNILVFDPANHTISRVDTLPPQVSTWSKLKILHTDHLLLETTLPDGSPGDILIDTGSPLGVGLAPPAWTAWKAAHPEAEFLITDYDMPDAGWSGIWEIDDRWADNITLGPVTLTDLPANRSNHVETSFAKNYIGTFGLYALGRLDLVLDGPAGFAYLRVHPVTPGPVFRGDWTIAPDVKLSPDTMLLQVADTKFSLGDFNGSLVDLDRVIALNPANADAYAGRGALRAARDLPGAEEDFNRALTLDPDTDIFTIRGICRMNAGNYPAAAADFAKAITLNDATVAEAVFLATARQSAGNDTGALAAYDQAGSLTRNPDLANYLRIHSQLMQLCIGSAPSGFSQIVASWKPNWNKTAAQFVAGDSSETQFISSIDSGSSDTACQAWYLIGMMRLLHHDSTGATDAFQKSLAANTRPLTNAKLHPLAEVTLEAILARAELARLIPNPPPPPLIPVTIN